jgi:hypothetical protein
VLFKQQACFPHHLGNDALRQRIAPANTTHQGTAFGHGRNVAPM